MAQMSLREPIPKIGEPLPGWGGYVVRRARETDQPVLHPMQVELDAEPNPGMTVPKHDTLGAFLIDGREASVRSVVLRYEHLNLIYDRQHARRQGLGTIAIGVLFEEFFARPDMLIQTTPITPNGRRLVESIFGIERTLTKDRWLTVVRPKIVYKLGSGPSNR